MRRKIKSSNIPDSAKIDNLTKRLLLVESQIEKGTSRKKKRDKLKREEADILSRIERLRGSKFGDKDLESIKKEIKKHSWDDIWSNINYDTDKTADYKYRNMVQEENYDYDIEKVFQDAELGDEGSQEIVAQLIKNTSRRLGLRR